jgi:RNA polymerase sigma-B factor
MTDFALPAQAQAAAAARRLLAANAPLDPVRLAEAQLMVSEVIANAVMHANLDEDTALTMTVDVDPARVRVGVRHPAAAPIERQPAGFGFSLIDRLSRRWGVEWSDGAAEVWFEVRTAGTGAALSDFSDQEVLARSIDDPVFRDEAINRFSNLASALARRFRGKGVADADLEQVALLGLLNAITRFDPEKGVFEPYATVTIEGELKRHLRDRAWSVRVPRGLQERSLVVGKSAEALTQTLGRPPLPEDIATDLGLTVEDVVEAIAANSAYRWESIYTPTETGATLAETIHDEADWSIGSDEWQGLAEGIRSLPDRERQLLYMRFYEDLTQTEIASKMGISQMHVSRLLARALERLRELVE